MNTYLRIAFHLIYDKMNILNFESEVDKMTRNNNDMIKSEIILSAF